MGKELAKKLSIDFMDIDQEIEKKYQMTILKFFKIRGEFLEILKRICHVS